MIRLPPRSTRTDTLFPYTTLFRSKVVGICLPIRLQCVVLVGVLRDGVGDGVVEAPVERAKLLHREGHIVRQRQVGDGLAQVAVVVDQFLEIGRAHVCTPVTNAHLVCRLLLEKNNSTHENRYTTLRST